MTNPGGNQHPLAVAMEWVAKITTVGLEMALPAIGGAFLDRRLGTSYWALVGLVLGVVGGMWHLLQMTAADARRSREARQAGKTSPEREAGRDGDTRKD